MGRLRSDWAQYTMLIGQVAARLRRDAVPAGDEGAIRVRGVDAANDTIIRTFGDLITVLEAELGDEGTRGSWMAGSSPHKDPRAPQNLVPIGGLERELRHRLGGQQVLYRSLRAAAATWPAPTMPRP